MMPASVRVLEVGPRDGLQNEAHIVPTADKIALIHALAAAGLREIEATSFVSPRRVPQMADAVAVMNGVRGLPGVRLSVLTPNLMGLEAALPTGPHEVVVFGAASQTFSQKNIHCSIEASFERFAPVVQTARAAGLSVRGAISCALSCPYEGDTPADRVGQVAAAMKAVGVQCISVADTTGQGTPLRVQRAFEAVLAHFELDAVSAHFHDTYGQALANVYACLLMGVSRFESSIAGLGGCPFALGATGNVATEDLVFMLDGLGLETGVDLAAALRASRAICGVLGRPPASRVAQARWACGQQG
jgi:hydroxymethylglutaryl-CoA lyase